MTIRYGISLILEPAGTAGLHRARQVICSQYGRWAAEMHSVHLPLTDYFPCPEAAVPGLEAGLEGIAADFRSRNPQVFLARQSVVAQAENRGHIYVEFAEAGSLMAPVEDVSSSSRHRPDLASQSQAIDPLRDEIAAILRRHNLRGNNETDDLRFALLQYADLSEPVFRSATLFAKGVLEGVGLSRHAGLSELALFRYESEAAGDDWNNGSWAADLRWQIRNSYPLTALSPEP